MNFISIFSKAVYKEEECHNPEHAHRSPLQKMYSVPYKGRVVEITQDGNRYNVKVDNGFPRVGIDYQSMIEWVENEIKQKGDTL